MVREMFCVQYRVRHWIIVKMFNKDKKGWIILINISFSTNTIIKSEKDKKLMLSL